MSLSVPLSEPYTHLRRRLAATRCVACGLPLSDAQSVALGVGPDCRKRLRLTKLVKARPIANASIAMAAICVEEGNTQDAVDHLRTLLTLDEGYRPLVERVHKRLFKLRVVAQDDGTFHVYTPYSDAFVQMAHDLRLRWLPVPKCRLVPADKLNDTLAAMAQVWPGWEVLMSDGAILPLAEVAHV